jgi:hypothetical protein
MLDAGIHPSLVVAEFIDPLLNSMRKGYVSEEYWLSAGRLSLRQLLFLEPYFGRPDHIWRDWLQAQLAPWYVLRPYVQKTALATLSPPTEPGQYPWDIWGHHTLAEAPPQELRKYRKRTHNQYAQSLATFQLGRGPAQAMRDLVQRCRKEGIPIVLVVMPESRWFRRLYSAQGQEALKHLLAEMRDDYQVPVIDATEWSPSKAFQDGHHLMANGARAFTLRLRGELECILAASPNQPLAHNDARR